MLGSKSKSVLCKTPIRDIWHRGSAVILIVVVVAEIRAAMPIFCANWALKVSTEWSLRDGQAGNNVPLRDSPREKKDSNAVLVCRNVPEAVLTCQSSGCTSTVA